MSTDTPVTDGRDPWSATTQDLIEALMRYRDTNREAVVATIVDVEGSAYRRPGAKMLIQPGSDSLGGITAGCLEDPVISLAADVLETRTPTVETFDLMDDDEWGLGLGCNGIIDILLEPLDKSWDPALAKLESQRPVAMITATAATDGRVSVGDRVLMAEDRTVKGHSGRSPLPDDVVANIHQSVSDLKSKDGSASLTTETEDGEVTAFVDWLTPAPDLLLFGTQNDVQPVSRLAHDMGFRVIVASARGARASSEQFPHAHEVRTTRPMDIDEVLDDPQRTYAVLMSHNLLEDRLALVSLLDTAVPYIGLMGPRKRFEEIRDAIATEGGRELTESELARIATPVGLDVGGGEPIHIALSIVGEVLAVHNDREGGRLKSCEGPIHRRLDP